MRTRALGFVVGVVTLAFAPALVAAASPAPTAPPVVAPLCATDNDYAWGIGTNQTGLADYDVEYSTDLATWNIPITLTSSILGLGHTAIAFTSKDAGSTFSVRWTDAPALVGSSSTPSTTVCPSGTITVKVTLHGGSATPSSFMPAVAGQQPNPPFATRATVAFVLGTPVTVQPGWYLLTPLLDGLPSGCQWQSTTCGTDSTAILKHPRLEFEVDPTGPVQCEVVYQFGVATRLTDGISAGVNRGTAGFGRSSVVVPKGAYVTYLIHAEPKLAGKVLEIWTKTRTGPWMLTTARAVAADGTVHYYARLTAWTAFWAKWAGDDMYLPSTSHGRIATFR